MLVTGVARACIAARACVFIVVIFIVHLKQTSFRRILGNGALGLCTAAFSYKTYYFQSLEILYIFFNFSFRT